ncbi:hypothetical protein, partial [Bradyrhizobium sp.]|uniref:hypothetical protein n=1 Tax=Bradyrhizobium sp. TaxID=376 RepID=UPI002736F020
AAARSLGRQTDLDASPDRDWPKTPKKHDGRVTSPGLCRIRTPNPRNGRIDEHTRSPRLGGWGATPMEILR